MLVDTTIANVIHKKRFAKEILKLSLIFTINGCENLTSASFYIVMAVEFQKTISKTPIEY